MWNTCKGKRTGPSFPSCSRHLSGRDLQIPPLERVWQLHNGAASSRSDCFPPAPKSTCDRWGESGGAQHLPLSLLASSWQRAPRAPPATATPSAPAAPADAQRARAAGSRAASPPDCSAAGRAGEIRPRGSPRGAIWPQQSPPAPGEGTRPEAQQAREKNTSQ